MTLSEIAIKRPVFTIMISLGIVVLGVMGFTRLPVNLFPDVEFPVVSITTIYPGASPTEVESEVTDKIEDAIASISGVDKVLSFSRESVSQVIIQFDLDVDLDEAATQVRERVAQARRNLPRELDSDPTVARFDIGAAPVLTYTLGGSLDQQELRDFAEDTLKPWLENVEGVANVEVLGGLEREIHVDLDLDRMQSVGLTPLAIVERIRQENVDIPAGGYDEGERRVAVRTQGQFRSVDELARISVGVGPSGAVVRLSDVATVTDSFEEPSIDVRANGERAVVFNVLKASGANTVEVSRGVAARLAELQMPQGVTANLLVDQAVFILENAEEVEIALIFGGAMAILVILLFLLDLRSTFISGLALPTSILGAFFIMYIFDFSLNMMTLLGLSLAIGLLIDDSIVVRENIMKYLERGDDPEVAAAKGTREITLAVLATTATLCAVFVPVAFSSGIVGQFFREFGITIAGATILSAWVALTLDPMLSARLAKKPRDPSIPHRPGLAERAVAPIKRFYEHMDGIYYIVLRWILGTPKVPNGLKGLAEKAQENFPERLSGAVFAVVARKVVYFFVSQRRKLGVAVVAVFIFMGSGQLSAMMGNEFTSPEDRGQFLVDIELPAGTRLQETSRLSLIAERLVEAHPLITTVYAVAGGDTGPNTVAWRVVTVPKTERTVTKVELQNFVREQVLQHMPGADVSISDPSFVEGLRDYPLQIQVLGDDLETLEQAALQVRSMLRAIPGTKDVDVQFSPGSPEISLRVDRDRAAQQNVSVAALAMTARASIEGIVAGNYRDRDDEIDIRVRLEEADRSSSDAIGDLRIPTAVGFLPLSDFARVGRTEGPSQITHTNRRRAIMVNSSVEGRPLGDIVAEFQRAVDRQGLPAGIVWELEGQAKQMNESNDSMLVALLLGVVFIYLVLASQFESFMHPVTIMMALPLAFVGAFIALFLQGSAMSMGATIGLILLMGLVTKNGILLVDHAVTKVREHGWTPHRAILDAAPARLRPILMTSAAMVLGMLPTAFGRGPGSEFRSPMAMGVIGGVISSTFLTLLVVPVIYLFMEGIKSFLVRWLLGRRVRVPVEQSAHVLGLNEAPAEE